MKFSSQRTVHVISSGATSDLLGSPAAPWALFFYSHFKRKACLGKLWDIKLVLSWLDQCILSVSLSLKPSACMLSTPNAWPCSAPQSSMTQVMHPYECRTICQSTTNIIWQKFWYVLTLHLDLTLGTCERTGWDGGMYCQDPTTANVADRSAQVLTNT